MQIPGLQIIIPREFKTEYFGEVIPICVSPNITQYQTLVSTSPRPILIENIYSQCYVWGSDIEYAYQTGLVARVYTSDHLYALSTIDGENEVALGSIDGSIGSTINIDALKYTQKPVTLAITSDVVSVEKHNENTVRVKYYNPAKNNRKVTMTVKDGQHVYFTRTFVANPNEFETYLVSPPVPADKFLKLVLEIERDNGNVERIERIFTMTGATGVLHPYTAIGIAVFFLVLTVTLFAKTYSLGYLGLAGAIAGLGALALAPQTPEVIMVEGLVVITLLYIIISIRSETGRVV